MKVEAYFHESYEWKTWPVLESAWASPAYPQAAGGVSCLPGNSVVSTSAVEYSLPMAWWNLPVVCVSTMVQLKMNATTYVPGHTSLKT